MYVSLSGTAGQRCQAFTWTDVAHDIFTNAVNLISYCLKYNWLIGRYSLKPIWVYSVQLRGTVVNSNIETLQRFIDMSPTESFCMILGVVSVQCLQRYSDFILMLLMKIMLHMFNVTLDGYLDMSLIYFYLLNIILVFVLGILMIILIF